ncbi:YtxH domain-containing protein [Domibacillus tundrae]|uniref:YtxH domain-containing protein n=1 Tax=Domibacillus tundrae TaxID=1587527 RepID=UPI000618345D|nr:YtxH domain-containing protein [Domibacillus tundrae]
MGKSKFFVSVAAGAAIGGTIALLDRGTRQAMSSWASYIMALAKDPEQLTESSRELIDRATETAQKINEDVSFIKGKVDDLKELTPEVKDLVQETKSTFVPDEQNPAASSPSAQYPSS